MCGLIGIVGFSNESVHDTILDALRKLSYMGYDSSGIAIADSKIMCLKTPGKVNQLQSLVDSTTISGSYGIGHVRWATHGAPDAKNAHPHVVEH